MQLRPYQHTALQRVQARLWVGVNRQVIRLATGAGKTPVVAALPDFLGFKGRTLVLVHREELAEQAADKLRNWNPTRTVGVERGERRSNGEQLVVASVQTIGKVGSKRLLQFNPAEFDAVVTDECHHSTAQSYRTIYQHFRVMQDKHRLSLGVTATVNRTDGKGLGKVFQEIVYSKGIYECIKEGWLADIKAFRIKTDTNLDGVGNVGGDFNLGELGVTVNTAAMNRLVVKSWVQHGQGRQTVVFAIDIQHTKDLAAAFQQQGHNFLSIWGDDPDRKDKMTLFRGGVVKGLVNCQLITEGVDIWQIGCVVLGRPTQSEGLFTQMVGRGSRIPDGISNLIEARAAGVPIAKDDCILIDMVHASSKHSLVTLPSLFGMNVETDLHGKSIVTVVDLVEKLKASKPYLDLTLVKDVNDFKPYAEQVDFLALPAI